MGKIVRNMSTPEARAFWESAEETSREVQTWPAWKRAGINVSHTRGEPQMSYGIKDKIERYQKACNERDMAQIKRLRLEREIKDAERRERLADQEASKWKNEIVASDEDLS